VPATIPTPHLKECAACLRDLSYGDFGSNYTFPDRFNDVCRACHNFRRKVSYYRRLEKFGRPHPQAKARALSHIPPLNDHNRYVLTSIASLPQISDLSAQFIKTGQRALIRSGFNPDSPGFSIYVEDRLVGTYLFPPISAEQFVSTSVTILRDLRIRLD
jgi:hypothetical protein